MNDGPVYVHITHFNWAREMSDMEMAFNVLIVTYIINTLQIQI